MQKLQPCWAPLVGSVTACEISLNELKSVFWMVSPDARYSMSQPELVVLAMKVEEACIDSGLINDVIFMVIVLVETRSVVIMPVNVKVLVEFALLTEVGLMAEKEPPLREQVQEGEDDMEISEGMVNTNYEPDFIVLVIVYRMVQRVVAPTTLLVGVIVREPIVPTVAVYVADELLSILLPAADSVEMMKTAVGWVVSGFLSADPMLILRTADEARSEDKKPDIVIIWVAREQVVTTPERAEGLVVLLIEQVGWLPVSCILEGICILTDPVDLSSLVMVNVKEKVAACETTVRSAEIETDEREPAAGVTETVPDEILYPLRLMATDMERAEVSIRHLAQILFKTIVLPEGIYVTVSKAVMVNVLTQVLGEPIVEQIQVLSDDRQLVLDQKVMQLVGKVRVMTSPTFRGELVTQDSRSQPVTPRLNTLVLVIVKVCAETAVTVQEVEVSITLSGVEVVTVTRLPEQLVGGDLMLDMLKENDEDAAIAGLITALADNLLPITSQLMVLVREPDILVQVEVVLASGGQEPVDGFAQALGYSITTDPPEGIGFLMVTKRVATPIVCVVLGEKVKEQDVRFPDAKPLKLAVAVEETPVAAKAQTIETVLTLEGFMMELMVTQSNAMGVVGRVYEKETMEEDVTVWVYILDELLVSVTVTPDIVQSEVGKVMEMVPSQFLRLSSTMVNLQAELVLIVEVESTSWRPVAHRARSMSRSRVRSRKDTARLLEPSCIIIKNTRFYNNFESAQRPDQSPSVNNPLLHPIIKLPKWDVQMWNTILVMESDKQINN